MSGWKMFTRLCDCFTLHTGSIIIKLLCFGNELHMMASQGSHEKRKTFLHYLTYACWFHWIDTSYNWLVKQRVYVSVTECHINCKKGAIFSSYFASSFENCIWILLFPPSPDVSVFNIIITCFELCMRVVDITIIWTEYQLVIQEH